MKTRKIRRVKIGYVSTLILLLLSFLLGCENIQNGIEEDENSVANTDSVSESNRTLLSLEEKTGSNEDGIHNVLINYQRGRHATMPRVMEMFIKHTPSLVLSSYVPGNALESADKKIYVQNLSDKLLRIIAFSSENTNGLDSGVIAELNFTHQGPDSAQVEILVDKPIFAPADSNKGLFVSDPLTLYLER